MTETSTAITDRHQQVLDFLNDTMDARVLSERDRDYYDHKQYTEAEIATLKSRNQAPLVINRIKPKVEGLVGLYMLRETDPKAYPRTQKHDKAAHAVTDGLRFVADNNEMPVVKTQVANDFFVEGVCGGIADVKQKKNGEIEIRVSRIPWDRIYFDPHSRELDFEDARFKGMILWMDEEQVKELFPDVDTSQLITNESFGEEDETFEDRPKWIGSRTTRQTRIRLAWHFRIFKGQWHMSIFTGNTDLVSERVSPYLDDDGEPTCPIELTSANIDRLNQRYGEVRAFIDLQDEINHRRSKALHLNSQRQTFGRKGSVKDVNKLKRELAKPDGHVEFDGEKFGDDFGILPTSDMSQAQFELYQDGKNELDAISLNAQLSGERQADLSGKAIDRLQQAGAMELNRQYGLLSSWEKRMYRQIWARIKQFWTEEKWIRVTDDQDNLRWVGLNSQITTKQFLEEKIQDESLPLVTRRQFAAAFDLLGQMEQSEDQQVAQVASFKLAEPIEVTNQVAELDVDIILDQSFNVINIQQEQFEMLAKFAQGSDIDIIDLIRLSELRGKDELIEKIEKSREQLAQSAGNVQRLEAEKLDSETQLNRARAAAEIASIEQNKTEKEVKVELDPNVKLERELASKELIAGAQIASKEKIERERMNLITEKGDNSAGGGNDKAMVAVADALKELAGPREVTLKRSDGTESRGRIS